MEDTSKNNLLDECICFIQNHARSAAKTGVDLMTMPPHAYYTKEGIQSIEILKGNTQEWVTFVNKKMVLGSEFVLVWFLVSHPTASEKVVAIIYDKKSNYPLSFECTLGSLISNTSIQMIDISEMFPELLYGYNYITYH